MEINKILERTKNIIIRPKNEWFKIESEGLTHTQVLMNYGIPVLSFMSIVLFVTGIIHHDFTFALANSLLSFAVQLLAIIVSSYVLNELPKNFGGASNLNACFNVVVYSSVPSWAVTIVIAIAPSLSSIGPIALFSFYIFYLGLNALIPIPNEKRIGFNLIGVLILFLSNSILGAAGHKILYAIVSSGNISF